MPNAKTQPAVGIDLGTTFSAVAYLNPDGRPETIRNSEGDLTTPSAVFFDHQRPIVGIEAVEAGLLEPDRLAQFAKRDVGEVFYEKRIRGKHLPAEVIQALVLRKLKADAELKLGAIKEAVITVPAYFNEPCRKATQDAGQLAGLKVLDIINEPTAAAITYGVEQGFLDADGSSNKSEKVLVYDLGGGTFDVTVMQIEEGHFNTIATAGDVYLGGIDWDGRLVDLIAEAFHREHGIDPREDPQAEQELLRKANQTKHALTQRDSVVVAFANGGRRMRTEISQQDFADRCADLVERTLMTVRLVLDDAGTDWSQLTRLILVGGSTRMPMIREELQRLSGMELDRSLSPDEAVSHGAALYAGMLQSGNDDDSGISVSNVNSHDLGVLAVDPKTDRPRRKIMIPRNSKLPAQKTVRFRTHTDSQANVKIQVVEGGDNRGINATQIGKCVVDDIPKGTPKGTAVEVCFDYKRDGRLTVHASLPDIDRKITMTLDRAAGLSEDEIAFWIEKLDEGLSDAALGQLPVPDASGDPSPSGGAESVVGAMPVDTGTFPVFTKSENASPDASKNSSSDAAAILNVAAGTVPSALLAANQDDKSAGAIQIDVGTGPASERLSGDDAKKLSSVLGDQPDRVRQPVELDLASEGQPSAPKADSEDLKRLAALGGESGRDKPAARDVPIIVTDSPASKSTPSNSSSSGDRDGKSKKSGGFFRRKKR